jgi:diacylglycerol kinase (ATP)
MKTPTNTPTNNLGPPTTPQKPSSIPQLRRSLGHAVDGLRHTWHSQRNFRLELRLAALALALAIVLGVDVVPILLCIALVLSLETMNTAIEATIDLLSPAFHPLARIAKDAAAGAVLLSAIISLCIGVFLFVPPIFRIIQKLFI